MSHAIDASGADPGDDHELEASDHDFGSDEPLTAYQRFDCTGTDPAAWAEAAEAARTAAEAGECIVLPTDTVYGIGADAFSADAVQRLLDAKMRGRDMPPPVLIADASLIRALATDVPESAKALVAEHWPGPLTVICKIQPSLRMDLGDTEGTIALRVPDHELTREVLRRTGPMAVSSANISGKPAAVSCDDAVDQLGDRVAVYLDGGPLPASAGVSSTIVDFTQNEDGEVLRRGALALEVLRQTLPDMVDLTAPEPTDPDTDPPDPATEPPPQLTVEPSAEAASDLDPGVGHDAAPDLHGAHALPRQPGPAGLVDEHDDADDSAAGRRDTGRPESASGGDDSDAAPPPGT